MEYQHLPVLFEEALTQLAIKTEGVYVDGTFGRGGHTQGILARLGRQGKLYALDKDTSAIQHANSIIKQDNFQIAQASFKNIDVVTQQWDIYGKVDGILLDLGVSSPQLDEAERGFSFLRDGPLDMRMDTTQGISAKQWINTAGESEISMVLKNFGEERFSSRIARSIVNYRTEQAIETTLQLAKIISEANPALEKSKHPATRSFQAIRIYINHELNDLEIFLDKILDVMAVGGRICIISFHSLEDRMVKRFFRKEAKGDDYPKHLPIRQAELNPKLRIIGKDIRASAKEYAQNIRSRSAIMRVAEKIA